MIRQIIIEAERPDDAQSMFRLSIDANLIAKDITVAQAHYLVGEVFGAVGLPTTTRDGDVRRRRRCIDSYGPKAQRESERPSKAEADILGAARSGAADRGAKPAPGGPPIATWRSTRNLAAP